MNKLVPQFKFWRQLWLALLLVGLAGGAVALLRPALPPVTILHQPFQSPTPVRDWAFQWVPQTAGWAWLWRLQPVFFGRRKPVRLNSEVIALADASPAALAHLSLGRPDFADAGGVQVWFLSEAALKAVRERCQTNSATDTLHRCRISTAEEIDTSLCTGHPVALNGATNQVGLTVKCFAHVHPKATDLNATFQLVNLVTNSPSLSGRASPAPAITIQTNLDLTARLQIPHDSGVFLLNTKPAETGQKWIGVIIDPPQGKG